MQMSSNESEFCLYVLDKLCRWLANQTTSVLSSLNSPWKLFNLRKYTILYQTTSFVVEDKDADKWQLAHNFLIEVSHFKAYVEVNPAKACKKKKKSFLSSVHLQISGTCVPF